MFDEILKGSWEGEVMERNLSCVFVVLFVVGVIVFCEYLKWGNGSLWRFFG